MKASCKHPLLTLLSGVLLLSSFMQQERLAGQAKAPPKPGDLIMAQQLMPLTPLGEKTFPDNGSVHSSARASVFMWPADLPAATHRANSILARMALVQYEPGGGTEAQVYTDIRERAIYVIAGRAKFRLGNSENQVGAGDLIFAPSGVKHGFEVEGEAPLRIILMEWRSGDMSKKRSLAGTIVSERLRPLKRLSSEDAGSHQGISASPFVTPQDYPTLSHKGNSSIAWISLQQYDADPTVIATSPHTHHLSEQVFYLVEGRARFELGDLNQEVGPGELVYVPRHVKHGYVVLDEKPVKWLMISWSGK